VTTVVVDIAVTTDTTGMIEEETGLIAVNALGLLPLVVIMKIAATGLRPRLGGIMMIEDLQGTMTITPGVVMMTADILTTIMTVAGMTHDAEKTKGANLGMMTEHQGRHQVEKGAGLVE